MAEVKLNKTGIKGAKYIVSACLIGRNCFFNGSCRNEPKIKGIMDSGEAIALCPEELGGLKTPRPPAEIFAGSGEDVLNGKAYVFNKEGRDITLNLIKGSREFLSIAKEYGVRKAILKARSPCCGRGKIYDGTFTNKIINGNGITAAMLLSSAIDVVTDEEFLRGKTSFSKKRSKPRVPEKKKDGKSRKSKRK